jgi:hypothetical protein
VSDVQLITCDTLLDVPADIAVCPYCGAALYVQFEAWSQEEDGSWSAENVHADCALEPDIRSDKWDAWSTAHSVMPYVYQLPVDQEVEKWVNEHYRFILD